MKARDIMTTAVVTIEPSSTVAHAIRLMLQRKISGLPVVEAGRLVGMLTEGDLLRRAETGTEHRRPRWLEFLLGPGRLAEDYAHSHGRKVEEVMTPSPVSKSEEASLEEIVHLMEKRHIKRVPIDSRAALEGSGKAAVGACRGARRYGPRRRCGALGLHHGRTRAAGADYCCREHSGRESRTGPSCLDRHDDRYAVRSPGGAATQGEIIELGRAYSALRPSADVWKASYLPIGPVNMWQPISIH